VKLLTQTPGWVYPGINKVGGLVDGELAHLVEGARHKLLGGRAHIVVAHRFMLDTLNLFHTRKQFFCRVRADLTQEP